ncbi:MAG TPA: MATE family efflux transporter [Kofleriaceae bacterium]
MSEIREQIKLAIPLAAQQVGFQLMGTVDAAWLGRYNNTAIAAAGVGNNLLFAITAIGLGVIMGMESVVPKAIGAGRPEDARRYFHAGLRLALIVGLASTLLVIASPHILTLADVDKDVAHDARIYIYLRSVGVIPFLLQVAFRGYLAARGITRPLVLAVVLGNIANFFLDWLLIFGSSKLGIPALGILGAALATVSVQVVIIGTYFLAVRIVDKGQPLPRSTKADMKEIVKYGAPVGGQLFAEVGIFGVSTVVAAHLGKVPAAAHSIALNLCSFTFSIAMGIGAATSVRVGHAVGAWDIPLARRRGWIGMALGLIVMGVGAIALVAVPSHIAALLTDQSDTITATVPLLMIAAVFQLSDGTQAIAAGALRGFGNTRATLVGNIVGHYGVGLAISLSLAFAAGMGVVGLWWGLSAGLTATALYLVLRFAQATANQKSD